MRAERALRLAGYMQAGSGNVLLSDAAARLITSWRELLSEMLRPFAERVLDPPAFIEPEVLAKSGYDRAFPGHVVRARGRGGRQLPLTPAACLHVYPLFAGARVRAPGTGLLVEGRCARFEDGRWRHPFRLLGFRMLELVLIGEGRWVERRLERAEAALDARLGRLGLAGTWRPATDPFFADGPRLLQRLVGGKRELALAGSPRVAIASANRHGDHFGRAFRIGSASGVARSACLAFGLERLAAGSLVSWGPRQRNWPAELRS